MSIRRNRLSRVSWGTSFLRKAEPGKGELGMSMWVFRLAIALGAFLLFLVQPLIARFILPWFGGGPTVWTGCMLFFQVALLAGYAYSHVVIRSLGPIRAAKLHGVWLVVSLLFLPLIPSERWQPEAGGGAVVGILLVLVMTVGLPYLVLSTTGPLIQSWFVHVFPQRSPYRLFALSNLGSLVGLFAYPFLFEPWFKLSTQAWGWSALFVVYALACAGCLFLAIRKEAVAEADVDAQSVDPNEAHDFESLSTLQQFFRVFFWLLLAFVPSLLLVSTTAQISQEVAVVPFLWTLPLGLYLLSFVICFDRPRWYHRGFWGTAMVISLALAAGCLYAGPRARLGFQLMFYCGALFTVCVACHGELFRYRPNPRQLTLFYLCLSIGGALGGLFVALVAPIIFADYWELSLAYFIAPVIMLLSWSFAGRQRLRASRKLQLALGCGGLLTVLWGCVLWIEGVSAHNLLAYNIEKKGWLDGLVETAPRFLRVYQPSVYFQDRDEYGVLKVTHGVWGMELVNGKILHGVQPWDEEHRMKPTSYYSARSGLGVAMQHYLLQLPLDFPRKVGVIGLGTGAIAAWGEAGDHYTFYELNPNVKRVAEDYFSYLKETPADQKVVLGDARLALEREYERQGSQKYQVLVLDAFSSDAIPMHLLTSEAMEVYLKHLTPNGILAVHVSNRFLNLPPLVRNLAEDAGYRAELIVCQSSGDGLHAASNWVLVTQNQDFLAKPEVVEKIEGWGEELQNEVRWTDDFGSLWQVIGPRDSEN